MVKAFGAGQVALDRAMKSEPAERVGKPEAIPYKNSVSVAHSLNMNNITRYKINLGFTQLNGQSLRCEDPDNV